VWTRWWWSSFPGTVAVDPNAVVVDPSAVVAEELNAVDG
jgi:hypothetical protein